MPTTLDLIGAITIGIIAAALLTWGILARQAEGRWEADIIDALVLANTSDLDAELVGLTGDAA